MKIKLVNDYKHTSRYTHIQTMFNYDDTPIEMMNNHEEIWNRAVILVYLFINEFRGKYFSDHNRIMNIL